MERKRSAKKSGITYLKDRLGVPALRPHKKASKRIIFADLVTKEGASWILRETGICIKFTPNAVQAPIMVTSSLWCPGTVSPPLEEGETLVSNIIELACDYPADIEFSKVTVTLSHSATELRGYELVLKEQTDSDDNVWKDLETSCPLDPLSENSASQSHLRFAQAKITSFSMYAVISRLKSYKFLVSEESPELTSTVREYPDISLTVPTRSLPSTEDFAFTLKLQQTPNDDFEERGVFFSPILHISCPVEVKLEEPALIRIPITLEEKQIDLQNLSSSQIRVFHRCTRRKSQEWAEITRKLKTPPKLENGVVSFQVKRFSQFVVGVDEREKTVGRVTPPILDPSAPQSVGFLACLCDSGVPEEYLLILCCFPNHINSEVRKDVASKYSVILYGESTSDRPLNKEDQAFFLLPDTYTLISQENTFLTFFGHGPCEKPFPVFVKSTQTIQSIRFFKLKEGHEEKQILCKVSLVKTLPLQESPRQPASKLPSSEREPLSIAKYPKLKETVATFQHLLPLKEDLGNCWKDLGIVLKLSPAALRNIDTDYRRSTEKADAMLGMWMEKEANAATLGCLAAALHKIEKNNIVEKLIEQLDNTENEKNEVSHARCRENKNELSGESSFTILSEIGAKDCQENDEDDGQAEESEILQEELTKLQDEVTKLNSDLKNEKELKERLQQQVEEFQILEQELKSLQDKVTQKEEVITRLTSELKDEKDLTQKLRQEVEESQILEAERENLRDTLKEKEASILRPSSELKSERGLPQELEQKLQQRLEESQILEEEHRPLRDQDKEREAVTKLVSDLMNERKRVQELEQRVSESELNNDAFKRIQEDVKEKGEEIEELNSKLEEEKEQIEKQVELLRMLLEENKILKDREIKALKSELEHARKEVKEKENRIKELTLELEDVRK